MNKMLQILLAILICFFSLGILYIGFVFFVGSGFIFAGDIDYSEEQVKASQWKVILASIFGLILMLISCGSIFLCGIISQKILTFFGVDFINPSESKKL